jgi:AcrR family transcriptional regulator
MDAAGEKSIAESSSKRSYTLYKYYTDRYNKVMDNRTRILDCALLLFSARGYDAVGIQEVVEAAGVTKPTLYHYFNSKRGLLEALLETQFAGFAHRLRQAAAPASDLPLALENLIQVYFDFALQQPQFCRMRLSMYFAPPDSEPNQAVLAYAMEQYEIIETLFGQALSHMYGRRAMYAAAFIGTIDTYIGLFLNNKVELNGALTHLVAHQFMHGIYS